MIVKLTILFGFLFTIGNIMWDKLGLNEPKIMYVPLSIFLFLLLFNLRISQRKEDVYKKVFVTYLLLLAAGNIIKQIFYSDSIKQINDYVFGGLVTIWLIVNLILCLTKQHYGKKQCKELERY